MEAPFGSVHESRNGALEDEPMRAQAAVLALVLVPAVLEAADETSPKKGKEFTPVNKRFTVTMPDGEKTTKRTRIFTIRRYKLPMEMAQTTRKDGTIFTAASFGVPALIMRQIPADERQGFFRDALVKQLRGKVVKDKDIKLGKWSGKEYSIERPGGVARMQLYIVYGFVLHAIVEGKTKEQVNSKEANAFFTSFKLSQKD